MNRCTSCGGKVVAGPQKIERSIGERIFVSTVDGWSCPDCGEAYYPGDSVEAAERVLATWLATHGISTPGEIKFMRKAAGIKAADLAALLGVSAETVSHWETGKHKADAVTRATIARLVLDALRGEDETRGLLKAQEQPDTTQRVSLGPAAA